MLNDDALSIRDTLLLTQDAIIVPLPHVQVHCLQLVVLPWSFALGCLLNGLQRVGEALSRLVFVCLDYEHLLAVEANKTCSKAVHHVNQRVWVNIAAKVWLHEE